MGTVFNIQKFCLHDGDGIRTNVFLKGCPLRCIWCHNPEGLERTPSLSLSESRCTGCGRCLPGCPAREIKDGKVTVDRSKCTLCGKCVKACLSGACEIIG
ncbi:MAG: 4Fe-4S binding protein, partial [Clostridia bacterium]|nr:4Fe-4S binding protein [Clostridia bacterium]